VVCDVGRVFSFSAVEMRSVANGVGPSVSGLDLMFLWRNSGNFGSDLDRTVGRCKSWSRVVDRAQAQQAVDLAQASLSTINLPLSALDVVVGILDTLTKRLGLLARESD